jgi:hypothetical protein
MRFVSEFDLADRIFAKQDSITGLHVGRHQLASFGHLALADRDNLAFLRLLLGSVGYDNPGSGRQGWKSWKVKVLLPSFCRQWADSDG